MADLTPAQLPVLSQPGFAELGLPEGFIYPHYSGRSILNLPSSICKLLGAPGLGAAPLVDELLIPLGDDIQRVILVLMDALALHRLREWMYSDVAPVWAGLADQGRLSALTSITPSTTSAALTSLWTGRSPTEHGITGYEMWMKEYGLVANTILHSPMSFGFGSAGSLEHAGFEAKKFVQFPALGSHLAAHGLKTYALQHRSILGSGLSTILFRDVDVQAFHTAADLWINLRILLEQKARERFFAWVYWSEVDHFGHLYGPDDERTAAEFATFSHAMETLFLARLTERERQGTLLVLTADHGQITTPIDRRYELRHHPDLLSRLHIAPTGENRLAYLYVRPGQSEPVREYLENAWPGRFSLIRTPAAVHAGLFGPGRPHPGLFDRLGDMIVVARGDAYLWWADKDNHLIGRHGGLHPEEMLVPFLTARL
jgi:hypothetical protein